MKYQVMPDLSEDDYQALKKDIQTRGVMVAVEYDEEGNVLDGHHRLKICEELGITDFPKLIREGFSESEKRTHARQLNMARRHLTQEERRKLIREQLTETPEKSDRQIATGLGVDHKTVGVQREKLESSGEIPQLEMSIGADGKERPRQVQRREEPKQEETIKEVEVHQLDIDDMVDEEEPDESPQVAYTLPPVNDIPVRREKIPETTATSSKTIDLSDILRGKVKEDEKNHEKYMRMLDLSTKVYNEFKDIIIAINDFEITPERMEALYENCNGGVPAEDEIEDLEDSIQKLKEIQMFYRRKKGEKRGFR